MQYLTALIFLSFPDLLSRVDHSLLCSSSILCTQYYVIYHTSSYSLVYTFASWSGSVVVIFIVSSSEYLISAWWTELGSSCSLHVLLDPESAIQYSCHFPAWVTRILILIHDTKVDLGYRKLSKKSASLS